MVDGVVLVREDVKELALFVNEVHFDNDLALLLALACVLVIQVHEHRLKWLQCHIK